MDNKKIICISGNCVSSSIPVFLQTSELFNRNYELVKVKPVHEIKTEEDVAEYKNTVSQCDLFFTVPVGGEKYKQLGIDTTTLQETCLKPNAKLYQWIGPYFMGYFPEQFYLHDINGNLIGECEDLPPYNNKIIFYGYVNKLSIEETYNLLYSETSKLDIEKTAQESLLELQRRENLYCPFCISDFIAANYKKTRLFWTINHPTNILILYITRQIAKILTEIDGQQYDIKPIETEFLKSHVTPILPSVAKTLNLEISDDWDNAKYTLDFIKRTYDYYDRHPDLVELNKHVLDDM